MAGMNPILEALQDKYGNAKEVYETEDALEAVGLIDTGVWVIITGCIQGESVNWVLVRFR